MLNPVDRQCWKTCRACTRCADKGTKVMCASCSGRFDNKGKWDPYYIDDRCRCPEGILQIRLQNGRFIQTKYPGDPYAGLVKTEDDTQDERDWKSYVYEQRERRQDPDFDPVTFTDGTSTVDYAERAARAS